jgi:hypothetical protein
MTLIKSDDACQKECVLDTWKPRARVRTRKSSYEPSGKSPVRYQGSAADHPRELVGRGALDQLRSRPRTSAP